MKKLFISLGAVAALLLIVVVGLLVYVVTFDPNENKDWIAGKFNEATGRELTLGGNVGLTWYPWLGLTVDDVAVSGGEGFTTPLLHADHAALRIKLLPLLRGAYEIDTVSLHGARVNLEVLPDGRNNWELATADGETQATDTAEGRDAPIDLILAGVDIQDTSLVYANRQAGTHYEINNLDMTVAELVYGEPLDIVMTLDALSRTPELAAAATMRGTVTYDVDNGRYDLNPLTLDATVSGPDVPSGSAGLGMRTGLLLDIESDTLVMSNLEVTALDTRLSAGIVASRISTATPAVDASLNLRGDGVASLFRILEQDELAARIGELDNAFSIVASMNADMQTGTVNVPELQAMLLGADINGTLDASRINTDTPVLNGNLTATGPDLPTLLEVAGMLQGSDSALSQAGRDLGSVTDKAFRVQSEFTADLQAGDIQLPMLSAALLGFQLDGSLNARDLHASDGTVDGMLNLQGGRLREVLAALGQPDLAEVAESMTLDVGVSGSSSALRIDPLNLELVLAGDSIPNSPQTLALVANPVLNLVDDSVQMQAFTLTGLGLDVNGSLNASSFVDNPAFNGTLNVPAFDARALLQQLNQPVPATADTTVLTNVALATAFQGTSTSISLSELEFMLDESRITGDLAVSDFAMPSSSFDVNIDRIDADRYLPPPVEAPAGGGSIGSQPLPIEALRQLAIDGALNIGELVISGMGLRDIVVELTAADGDIVLNPVRASLYDGTFAGDLRLNVQGTAPTATVNTTLSAINLEPLLRDFTDASAAYLTGMANIELALSGAGSGISALKHNLNGSGSLAVDNGILTGVDVAAVLQSIETMIRSRQLVDIPQGGATPFENFSATLDVRNGIVSSDDLLIAAPGWHVNGSGILVDLANDTLAFDLLTSVDPATAATAEQEYDLGGYTLPIACTGNLSSPRCLPDARQIIAAAVTNAVQQRLGDLLQDRLGGGQQQPAPDAPRGETPEEPEPVDPSEELLDRALERLSR